MSRFQRPEPVEATNRATHPKLAGAILMIGVVVFLVLVSLVAVL